jgi:hypothetical protein
MPKPLTADEILPLVACLSAQDQLAWDADGWASIA